MLGITSVLVFLLLAYQGRGQQTFNKTDIMFVISRFNEPMEHLCYLKHYRHVVYNRGDAATLNQCGFRVSERTENVGRESYVYLSHIIDHYDKLPPALVCLQADNEFLKKDMDSFFSSGKLTIREENDGFAFLLPTCTSSRLQSHIFQITKKYGPDAKDLMLHGHEKLLNVNIANPRYAGFGYFIVTREAILRRPKSFYIQLARRIGDRNDAYEGHFYERAWSEIFLSKCAMDPNKYYCSLVPNLPCP